MNKHTKFSLIALIIFVLLLVLTVPALAKKSEPSPCFISSLIVNNGGHFDNFTIYGELEAIWENSTLYNYCTGTVSFGDQVDKKPG